MRDLQSRFWIFAKAAMFLFIGATSAALLLLENLNWQRTALLALVIWSFCRAYYFAFYVIEKYVDPSFRFSGLLSAVKFLLSHR